MCPCQVVKGKAIIDHQILVYTFPMSTTYITEHITVNPKQCGGKPCIRGMRIRVIDVLDLLSNGLSVDDVLSEFPKLEREDVLACIKYARNQIDHAVLSA
jgi:uncharacterized protein (DUF433 family)